MSHPEHALLRLLAGLDRMELPYLVGGSVASSVHGFWRATNDVDFFVRIEGAQVEDFIAEGAQVGRAVDEFDGIDACGRIAG